MVSDFVRVKLEQEVRRWDVDKDGFVEQEEFEAVGRKIAQSFGLQPGSTEYEGVVSTFRNLWTAFWAPADRDADGKVSMEEYIGAVEHLFTLPPDAVFDAAQPSIRALFDALDQNGNGEISVKEYTLFLNALNVDDSLCGTVFSRLDHNQDGRITRDEFVRHLFDYYTSDDPDAAGNWVFGPM